MLDMSIDHTVVRHISTMMQALSQLLQSDRQCIQSAVVLEPSQQHGKELCLNIYRMRGQDKMKIHGYKNIILLINNHLGFIALNFNLFCCNCFYTIISTIKVGCCNYLEIHLMSHPKLQISLRFKLLKSRFLECQHFH